jgi:hypothetical protein
LSLRDRFRWRGAGGIAPAKAGAVGNRASRFYDGR